MSAIRIPSPIVKIFSEISTSAYLKREDQIHQYISGNKFRKLKYNIIEAKNSNYDRIVSFGGAFSNHIHALSFSCKLHKIPLHLIIRGEYHDNPTLAFVREMGASLEFVDRTTYRLRNDVHYREMLSDRFPNSFLIPEGGSNNNALLGIKEMMQEIHEQLNYQKINFCVSYGSGGTSIGMMKAMRAQDTLHIFPALKMPNFETEFKRKCDHLKVAPKNYFLHDGFHFGGYAKHTDELINYINNFKRKYQISLDPIYTGKLLFGVQNLLENEIINSKDPIIIIHSGGLQAIAGFNKRFGGILETGIT